MWISWGFHGDFWGLISVKGEIFYKRDVMGIRGRGESPTVLRTIASP